MTGQVSDRAGKNLHDPRDETTFGPRAVYEKGCNAEHGENLSPCSGLQFFGHVTIDGVTEAMTVTLKDVDNRLMVDNAASEIRFARKVAARRYAVVVSTVPDQLAHRTIGFVGFGSV